MAASSSSSSVPSIPSTMRHVAVHSPGTLPSSLYVSSCKPPSLSAHSDSHCVLIRVHSFGINRADVSQRLGHYPPPAGVSDILGLEACGTIVELGHEVKKSDKFRLGERVMATLSGGAYAEYAVVDAGSVMHIPESLSLHVAAGIPEAFLTAFQLLTLTSRIPGPSDVVLIHAAASGVGTAAIQVARQRFGSTVVGTVGGAEKAEQVRSLGAGGVVNYRESKDLANAIVKEIEAATKGQKRSADFILDCVGGSYFAVNLQVISMDGIVVQYAFLGGASAPDLNLSALLAKRVQWLGSTLRNRSLEYKADLVKRFEAEVLPLIVEKKIEVKIDSIVPKEVANAHERMEKNLNIGKIIVTFEHKA